MPRSGKYDFKGIKKLGAVAIKAALASSPYLAWILRGGKATDLLLEFVVNWLANKGLVVINLGAILVESEWDQKSFDSAMEKALSEIELTPKMTPEQMKAIDNEVIKAFRKFVVIVK